MPLQPGQSTLESILEKELERLLGWVRAVETRTSFIIPLSTGMLGALAALAPTSTPWTFPAAISSSIALILLALSLASCALAAFPRTTGPKGSLIYFGGISTMELEQYAAAMKNLSVDAYIDDLVRQCHRNAQIAERKYAWIQRALGCLFLGAAPWTLSVFLLYTTRV